ncbi:SO_0444 family Cu/Zn efflux transporter [Marinicellulosiphila megalodicopiae]|uniref:SO_0444 family Cu/Zn efflux transporter n=1 Tax=Marinicellulosiphila megalodicopiae TaxID=2724896 RepID=UPI003BAEB8F4
MFTLVQNFYHIFTESAPFLLLGMLIAGMINQLIPKKWIENTLGTNHSIITAAFIGAPLPLCSCSVIPVAISIRRSGASKASTSSFLVSTPETGVDSIGITYALLGPIMALVRPISAIFSAIVTGVMMLVFSDNAPYIKSDPSETHTKSDACCAHEMKQKPTIKQKIINVFGYGFDSLLKDFMKWLLIGLMFAAIIQTYVPSTLLAQYGQGVIAMLLIVAVSIPMYICATASTPIAAGLLLSGVSPGAALVFMLTGPATNIATLMLVKNELGRRELLIYLLSVIGSALACGVFVNWLFARFQWKLNVVINQQHDMVWILYQVSAVILLILMLWQVFKLGQTKILNQ